MEYLPAISAPADDVAVGGAEHKDVDQVVGCTYGERLPLAAVVAEDRPAVSHYPPIAAGNHVNIVEKSIGYRGHHGPLAQVGMCGAGSGLPRSSGLGLA